MSAGAIPSAPRELIRESLRIAGEKVSRDPVIEVHHPYSGALVGTVPKATLDDVKRALRIARSFRSTLTRHDRYRILMKAGAIIASKRADLARLITLESGLCLKDSEYEVGRASDVLLFAANQSLVDDGEVFSCDLTAHGKSRALHHEGAAARRHHRDHSVQSSTESGDPQSGSRGGHQQPGRAQAQREDTADRVCA